MTDNDISILAKYVDMLGFDKKLIHDKPGFAIQSYSGWAIDEIMQRVIEEFMSPPPCVTGRPDKDVVYIIEEFAFEMDAFYEGSASDNREMFAIAREAAGDLLYFYIHERGKNE